MPEVRIMEDYMGEHARALVFKLKDIRYVRYCNIYIMWGCKKDPILSIDTGPTIGGVRSVRI